MENIHRQQLQTWFPVAAEKMAVNQDYLTPTTLKPELDDHEAAESYPPGFRFMPEDEELVLHYLVNCIPNHQPSVPSPPHRRRRHIIPEVNIYRYDCPEDLKELYPLGAVNKKDEWYFVTQLSKKHPSGNRPSRVCGAGYWKPTGKDAVIDVANVTARKKSLEYFRGKPPGNKTDWKMHEYKICKLNGKKLSPETQLEYPVICKIYVNTRKKDGKKGDEDHQGEAAAAEEVIEEVHGGGEKGSDQCQTGGVNSALEDGGGGGANVNPVPPVDDPKVAPAPAGVDQNVVPSYIYEQAPPLMDVYNQDYYFDGEAAWYDVNPNCFSFPIDPPGSGL